MKLILELFRGPDIDLSSLKILHFDLDLILGFVQLDVKLGDVDISEVNVLLHEFGDFVGLRDLAPNVFHLESDHVDLLLVLQLILVLLLLLLHSLLVLILGLLHHFAVHLKLSLQFLFFQADLLLHLFLSLLLVIGSLLGHLLLEKLPLHLLLGLLLS